MVDYREILRLLSLGYNLTQISESLHSSRNTIRDVRDRADKIGLSLSDDVTNQMLYALLYPERLEKVNVWMRPDCEYIHKELARKGVNLKLLWTECKVQTSSTFYIVGAFFGVQISVKKSLPKDVKNCLPRREKTPYHVVARSSYRAHPISIGSSTRSIWS